MSDKIRIQNIKNDNERTIQGLRTKIKEFKYKQTTGFVKPSKVYSIYYTLDKSKIYITGVISSSNSKIIEKINESDIFVIYTSVKNTKRQLYPETIQSNPSESDYRIGTITRYFTKKTNELSAKVFEITETTFNRKNNLYDYTSFEWRISGKKDEVNRDNSATLRGVQSEYPSITKTVFPLQLWIPPKNSPDDVQNKLNRLKTD